MMIIIVQLECTNEGSWPAGIRTSTPIMMMICNVRARQCDALLRVIQRNCHISSYRAARATVKQTFLILTATIGLYHPMSFCMTALEVAEPI